jgi:translation initiation factor IF-1
MSKEDFISTDGVVTEILPNALFRVTLEQGGTTILAHLAGKLRINNINVRLMDRVQLEISPYDLTKARITYRYKPNQASRVV